MSRHRLTRRAAALAVALSVAGANVGAVRAESSQLRISRGFGILYLPLFVTEALGLVEKHAKAAGLGDVKVSYPNIDGGNLINDAMISGNLDIAAIGVPGFLILWAKARGNAKLEIAGLAGLSTSSLYLNTVNANIQSLRDFTEKDKIAVPGIKTSLSAVVLQMAVAKEFGDANYAKLDPLTVGLPHPEALAVLVGGKTEVNSHFASPPFSFLELEHKHVRRVFNSVDLLGDATLDMVYAQKAFCEANPKLCLAFVAALDEANAIIASDRPRAADLYNQVAKIKTPRDQLIRMLEDKDTKFSTTPHGIMRFADFMANAGIIKQKAATWRDLFLPMAHEKAGS